MLSACGTDVVKELPSNYRDAVIVERLDITLDDDIEQLYVEPLLRCALMNALGPRRTRSNSTPMKPVNVDVFVSNYFEAGAGTGAMFGISSTMRGNVKLIDAETGSVVAEVEPSVATKETGIVAAGIGAGLPAAIVAGAAEASRPKREIDPIYLTRNFLNEFIGNLRLQSRAVDVNACIPQDPDTVAWWPPPPPEDNWEDEYGGGAFGQSYTRKIKKKQEPAQRMQIARQTPQPKQTQLAKQTQLDSDGGVPAAPTLVLPLNPASQQQSVIVFGSATRPEEANVVWEQIRNRFAQDMRGFVPALPTVNSSRGPLYHLIARPNHPSADPERSCAAVQAGGVFCEIRSGSLYPQ